MLSKEEIISKESSLVEYIISKIKNSIMFRKYEKSFDYTRTKLRLTRELITPGFTRDIEDVQLTPENKALLRIFERNFSMWEAGKDKISLFKTMYAFPSINEAYNHLKNQNLLDIDDELLPINLDEFHISNFINSLCGRAKSIEKSKSAIDASNRSRFFIIGDIASGKTTFLNYAFSTHYDYLDKMNIMWIRVDLTKTYHGIKTLDEALHFQIARVFRNNYSDHISENVDKIVNMLNDQFSFLIKSERIKSEEADHFINEWVAVYDKERNHPFHHLVQGGIKKYVESIYSMIYIFDGLDRLSPGYNFDNKIQEIQEYVLGSEKTKHLYLVVMRNRSHAELLNSALSEYERISLSGLRKVAKTFIVLPANLSDIVEKRLNLLCETWDDIIMQEKDDIIIPSVSIEEYNEEYARKMLRHLKNVASWISSDTIEAYYDIFLRFVYRGLSYIDLEESLYNWSQELAYRTIADTVGDNLRVLLSVLSTLQKTFLQTLQLLGIQPVDIVDMYRMLNDSQPDPKKYQRYIDILSSILTKHYRVIPALYRNQSFHTSNNGYYYDEDDNLIINKVHEPTQTKFVYNIFKGANVAGVENETYNLLTKIRLLQIINAREFKNKDDVLLELNIRFQYPLEHLNYDFEELLWMNMITVTPKTDPIYQHIDHYFSITKIGKNILQKLIFEYEYVRVIIDDIFLPEGLTEDLKDPRQYSFSEDAQLWNISQIPRITRFIAVVSEIESQEKILLSKEFPAEDFSNWCIHEKMYTQLIDVIEKTISKIKTPKFAKIYDIISKI